MFEGREEGGDDDADRLDIPIHAFDLVIADECHRGYTAAEQSAWRNTLDHFDALKIGLTATPAAHTTSYFQHLVYRSDYRQAVSDGSVPMAFCLPDAPRGQGATEASRRRSWPAAHGEAVGARATAAGTGLSTCPCRALMSPPTD